MANTRKRQKLVEDTVKATKAGIVPPAPHVGNLGWKASYRYYVQMLPPQAKNAVWQGLLGQAQMGNVAAIKMLIELGGEQVSEIVNPNTGAAQIIINIPKTED